MGQTSVGEILKKNRKSRGYTKERLAELLDINIQSVWEWEENISSPDLIQSLLIGKLYGISLEDMFQNLALEDTLIGDKKEEFQHEKWINRVRNREY